MILHNSPYLTQNTLSYKDKSSSDVKGSNNSDCRDTQVLSVWVVYIVTNSVGIHKCCRYEWYT